MNNYIASGFCILENKLVFRAQIARRKQLSFVKGKDRYHLYCRQGGQTVEVPIEKVEEYLESRAKSAR